MQRQKKKRMQSGRENVKSEDHPWSGFSYKTICVKSEPEVGGGIHLVDDSRGLLSQWRGVGNAEGLQTDAEIARFLIQLYKGRDERMTEASASHGKSVCTQCRSPLTMVCLIPTCPVSTPQAASTLDSTGHGNFFHVDENQDRSTIQTLSVGGESVASSMGHSDEVAVVVKTETVDPQVQTEIEHPESLCVSDGSPGVMKVDTDCPQVQTDNQSSEPIILGCGESAGVAADYNFYHRDGMKLYVCALCNKEFRSKSGIDRHIQVHAGHKPFSCRICERKFSQSYNVNVHLVRKHHVAPYQCRVCSERFMTFAQFNIHRIRNAACCNQEAEPSSDAVKENTWTEKSQETLEKSDLRTPVEISESVGLIQKSENKDLIESAERRGVYTHPQLIPEEGETELGETPRVNTDHEIKTEAFTSPETSMSQEDLSKDEATSAVQYDKFSVSVGIKSESVSLDCATDPEPLSSITCKTAGTVPGESTPAGTGSLNAACQVVIASVDGERSPQVKAEVSGDETVGGKLKAGDKLKARSFEGNSENQIQVRSYRVCNSESDTLGQEKKHVCAECHKKFKKISDLKRHQLIHTDNKPYRCEICKQRFRQSYNLHLHKVKYHQITPHQCRFCRKPFGTYEELQDHKASIQGCLTGNISTIGEESMESYSTYRSPANHVCSICGKGFLQEYELQRHVLTHSNSKQFVCEYCGKTFSKSCSLRTHVRLHALRPTRCPVCTAEFSSVWDMQKHREIHGDLSSGLQCQQCGMMCSSRGQLSYHTKVVHVIGKVFPCRHCGENFSSTTQRRAHWESTTCGRKLIHACPHCSKCFAKKDDLRRHVLIHTGVQPHSCTYCGRRFLSPYRLKHHMRQHIEIPYTCSICQEDFSTYEAMRNHKKLHKPEKCPICGKSFLQLDQHVIRSHKRKQQQKTEQAENFFNDV